MDEDFVIDSEENEEGINAKLKKLRDELKECQKEKDEYLAGWQRAKADFINARREEQESRLDVIKFSEEEIIKEILPILDSLEKALKEESWQELDRAWQDGIKSIYNQLLDALKRHKTEEIETKNKKFDPNEHETVGEIEIEDKKKDGMILEEARKGYKMDGKIIRASQVIIGKYKI